jgi:hypothetical protein
MSANTTILLQIFATIIQVLNAVNVAGLPAKWQVAFTGILAALQAIEGIIAHYFTPAGNSISGTTGQVKDSAGTTVATVPVTKA